MIKYKDGDKIGPYNILLVKRTVKKNNRWRGIFICPRCGKEFETAIGYIAYGQTVSCGCVGGTKNLIGKKFGKLTAMYPTDKRASGHIVWHCVCDCGQEKDVSAHHLMDGNVQSCGCSASKNLIGEKFGYLKVVDKMVIFA